MRPPYQPELEPGLQMKHLMAGFDRLTASRSPNIINLFWRLLAKLKCCRKSYFAAAVLIAAALATTMEGIDIALIAIRA